MKTLANDTNILIDLSTVGLLESLSLLPYKIHTVDFVIAEITDSEQKKEVASLIQGGNLCVYSFSAKEVEEIVISHADISGNLSIPDVSICYYAKKMGALLITGDRQLRKYAESQKVEVHGIIYIIDEMVKNGILSKKDGVDTLLRLMECNCRLPKSEIKQRLDEWAK